MLLARRRRTRFGVLVAVLVSLTMASLAAAGQPVAAQDGSLEDQREQARQEAVDKAAQVDALRADASELDAAITTLDDNVAVQQARVDDAQRTVDAIQAQLAAARAAQADAEQRADALRTQLQDVALAAYVRPPSDELAVVLSDEDPSASAKRQALAETRTRSVADVIDQVKAADEQAKRAAKRAAAALAQAEAAAAVEQASLAELAHARSDQQQLADDVQARLDRALSEAAAIGARDQDLADQISARERKLAARVAPSSSGSRPSWTSSGVTVTTVRGITVASSIADELEAMMAAAEEDGVYLTGSGYRDIETQIELRREHCGTSEYAIWDMPSGDCSPPVARPGYSMHEQGLAIDFVIGDDLIRSRGTTAFGWLSDHAADYGFYNLPSEPWHWSTTGS